MESLKDNIIHVIIACSFIIAVAAVVSGFATGEIAFLNVLTSAVIISLLAAILYVLEDMQASQKKRR